LQPDELEPPDGAVDAEQELAELARLFSATAPDPAAIADGRFAVEGALEVDARFPTYRARDLARHGREVELVIVPGTAARAAGFDDRWTVFLDRARRLDHPVVQRLLDAGRTDLGLPYLVYERLAGEPLDACLERRGALPLDQAQEIARQTLAGLGHAHARGLWHGDPGPRAIVLAPRVPAGRENPHGLGVRLRGVGLSSLLAPAGAAAEDAAPEPASDDPRIAADLAAVARLLFELATGTRPLSDRPEWDLVPDASGTVLPAALTRCLQRALARAPGAGYASAEALRRDLERCPGGRRSGHPSAAARYAAAFAAGVLATLAVRPFGVAAAPDARPAPRRVAELEARLAAALARVESLEAERLSVRTPAAARAPAADDSSGEAEHAAPAPPPVAGDLEALLPRLLLRLARAAALR